MQTYAQALSAGQAWDLGVPGSYFRLLSLTTSVDVIFKRHGVPIFTATGILDGFWSKPDGGFDQVTIVSAAAQTVTVGITSGDAGYDRAAGTVMVSSGSINVANVSGPFTQAAATVTNASANLIAANPNRRAFMVQNNDAAGILYLNLSGAAASTANGFKIPPGGFFEVSGFMATGAITAIGSAASNANVVVAEG